MDLKSIKRDLTQALRLVEGWMADGEVPAIERDMALRKIRDAYDAVMFAEADEDTLCCREHVPTKAERVPESCPTVAEPAVREPETPSSEPESPCGGEPASEPVSAPEPVCEEREPEAADVCVKSEIAEPALSGSMQSAACDAAEAETTKPELKQEPEPKTESASEPEQTEAQPATEGKDETKHGGEGGSLFGEEEILFRHPVRKSIIMSLYDDAPEEVHETKQPVTANEPAPAPATASAPTPTPAPSHIRQVDGNAVLGEVLGQDVQTIGDSITHPKDIAASAPVESLKSALSVADRFLLIRDLFDGDEKACEETVNRLDSFGNLDDCMVYIVENYSWKPSSDGAKLIMELLQRKFQ